MTLLFSNAVTSPTADICSSGTHDTFIPGLFRPTIYPRFFESFRPVAQRWTRLQLFSRFSLRARTLPHHSGWQHHRSRSLQLEHARESPVCRPTYRCGVTATPPIGPLSPPRPLPLKMSTRSSSCSCGASHSTPTCRSMSQERATREGISHISQQRLTNGTRRSPKVRRDKGWERGRGSYLSIYIASNMIGNGLRRSNDANALDRRIRLRGPSCHL